MRILVISADTRSIVDFRRDLMLEMIQNSHEVMAISPPKDDRGDAEVLKKDGIKVRTVSFNRTGMNPFKDFSNFIEIYKIVKEYKKAQIMGKVV